MRVKLLIILFILPQVIYSLETVDLKPDVDRVVKNVNEKGGILRLPAGPPGALSPGVGTIESWGDFIFVKHTFKNMLFNRSWNLLAEYPAPEPGGKLPPGYFGGTIFPKGIQNYEIPKSGKTLYFNFDFSPTDEVRPSERTIESYYKIISQFDTIHLMLDNRKIVVKSDGSVLRDQNQVYQFLYERFKKLSFLKNDPALLTFIVDKNKETKAAIGDRYTTLNDPENSEKVKIIRDIVRMTCKGFPGFNFEAFDAQFQSGFFVYQFCDYGFVIAANKGRNTGARLKDQIFIKIDALNQRISYFTLTYPDIEPFYTLSEDGNYFFAIAMPSLSVRGSQVPGPELHLLRFPVP